MSDYKVPVEEIQWYDEVMASAELIQRRYPGFQLSVEVAVQMALECRKQDILDGINQYLEQLVALSTESDDEEWRKKDDDSPF